MIWRIRWSNKKTHLTSIMKQVSTSLDQPIENAEVETKHHFVTNQNVDHKISLECLEFVWLLYFNRSNAYEKLIRKILYVSVPSQS